MVKRSFVPPEYLKSAFSCPHCSVYASQIWGKLDAKIENHYIRLPDFQVSRCNHCLNFCIWKEGIPIYPDTSQAPLPNPDLPEGIKKDFEESRLITSLSPRAAVALLRLCIQKLCIHLGEDSKDINRDIASLVSKGLNPKILQNLDVLRVTGKEAIRPGTLDNRDELNTAMQLSQLVNIIANALISQPKLLDELNEKLAEAKKQTTDQHGKEGSEKSDKGDLKKTDK